MFCCHHNMLILTIQLCCKNYKEPNIIWWPVWGLLQVWWYVSFRCSVCKQNYSTTWYDRQCCHLVYTLHISYIYSSNSSLESPVVHWVMGCDKKIKALKLVWRYPQLLFGFLAKGHLPWVSYRSKMIREIMKWSRGLCTDLLVFGFTAEENPRTVQLGNRRMKGLCDHSSSQMGYLSSKWGW